MTRTPYQFSELFKIKHGYAFKSRFFADDGEYVVLTPGNFEEAGGYRDQGANQKFYVGDIPDGYVLQEDDLLVAMTEQASGLLGSSAWITEPNRFLHNQRLGKIIDLDDRKLFKRFLYYLFNTRDVRAQIAATASGTKVRHTAPERIGKVVISLPPLSEQQTIANLLTAHDDLIEKNRRRIALLEEAARQLYREWFVRRRFPGHEHTATSGGRPIGWQQTSAYTVMNILSGGTPRTSVENYWDGEIPFYTPKDASETYYAVETERTITEIGLKNCNSSLYPVDTVFISARGTVGKLNLASSPMAMSQSCYALRGKGHVSQLFLFCAIGEAINHFKQHAVGAVFDAIVVETFKLIPFLLPDERLVRLFEEMVGPIFAQVRNLSFQNQRLRTARDLLLPRLMSGEIAV